MERPRNGPSMPSGAMQNPMPRYSSKVRRSAPLSNPQEKALIPRSPPTPGFENDDIDKVIRNLLGSGPIPLYFDPTTLNVRIPTSVENRDYSTQAPDIAGIRAKIRQQAIEKLRNLRALKSTVKEMDGEGDHGELRNKAEFEAIKEAYYMNPNDDAVNEYFYSDFQKTVDFFSTPEIFNFIVSNRDNKYKKQLGSFLYSSWRRFRNLEPSLRKALLARQKADRYAYNSIPLTRFGYLDFPYNKNNSRGGGSNRSRKPSKHCNKTKRRHR